MVALIARMVSDGKLRSSVGKGKASASMTLRLKVDRSTLQGHERTLVDKLFFDDRTETSTRDVRAHYRARGIQSRERDPNRSSKRRSIACCRRGDRRDDSRWSAPCCSRSASA